MQNIDNILKEIKFNKQGLIPVIAQQFDNNEVLMLAWMNKEALIETIEKKQVCYFSRSRQKLWRKGETSGQTQILKNIILDCDKDTLLVKIDQKGVACHTGRKSCFFNQIKNNQIEINQKIIKDPNELYN